MSRRKRNTTPLQSFAVAAVCVLFVMTALIGLYRTFSQEPSQSEDPPPVSPTAPENPASPEEPNGDDSSSSLKPHFHTILVGGLDDDNGGSDTNLLVALDAENKAINVVSLPRDTLLDVDWSVKKLNSAYHHGGFSRTMAEVSRLLGIPVMHYVTVDLKAFVSLVDAIGGVEFDVPLDMDYDDPAQDLHIHIPKGPRKLTGQEAIGVVRWRQNNDGTEYPNRDIGRIATQQAFLKAVAQQALRLDNVDKIPEFAEIFDAYVDTDLDLSNLIWLGEQALTIGSDNVAFYTLPGDGAGYYKGVSYYTLDPEAVLELVNVHFNPYQRDLTLENMDILVP